MCQDHRYPDFFFHGQKTLENHPKVLLERVERSRNVLHVISGAKIDVSSQCPDHIFYKGKSDQSRGRISVARSFLSLIRKMPGQSKSRHIERCGGAQGVDWEGPEPLVGLRGST